MVFNENCLFRAVRSLLFLVPFIWGLGAYQANASGLVADINKRQIHPSILKACKFQNSDFVKFLDPISGTELWKTDGTPAGTTLLTDTNPGQANGYGGGCASYNGKLYFAAAVSATQWALWSTDGSQVGTRMVKEIGPYVSTDFAAANGLLFFRADDGLHGKELWRTDGTESGTVRVTDISPGATSSITSRLVPLADRVLFVANDSSHGSELWSSDGTASGTIQIDIAPGSASSSPVGFIAFRNKLYFAANDGTHGYELWMTDGSISGTQLVSDINPSGSSRPSSLTVIGDTIFFSADDGVHGKELWRASGDIADTSLVADIQPGEDGSYPTSFFHVGTRLLFSAKRTDSGLALWSLDEDLRGASLVVDPNLSPYDPDIDDPTFCGEDEIQGVVYQNTLFFGADDGIHGCEVWKSNGVSSQTGMVRDFVAGASPSNPMDFVVAADRLFFTASSNSSSSITPHRIQYALTGAQSTDYVPFLPATASLSTEDSTPEALGMLGESLIFRANDDLHGKELWISDGSEAGTRLLADITSGEGSTGLEVGFATGDRFVFTVRGANLTALWVTDGTPEGTQNYFESSCSDCASKAALGPGGMIYLPLKDDEGDEELWKTDGTLEGTERVKNINPSGSSRPSQLSLIDGVLYFSATDEDHGNELWRSDGSAGGTFLVKDIEVGVGSSSPGLIVGEEGRIFFRAHRSDVGSELFLTDGTSAGTRLVKDIEPGSGSSSPRPGLLVNGTLYFRAIQQSSGAELWKSDGTATGTTLVRDINPGVEGSVPSSFSLFAGKVFFSATTAESGRELWVTDGAPSGTALMSDVFAGPFSGSPSALMVVEPNFAIFQASSERFGRELFYTDGNASGTGLFLDFNVGAASSIPTVLGRGTDLLFLRATTPGTGSEVWAIDLSTCPLSPQEDLACSCLRPDADQDGIIDCEDECSSDPSKSSAGVCGCGFPESDSDGDSSLDCVDACPSDASKATPGICGCNVPDIDTNGDGVIVCGEEPSIETLQPARPRIRVRKRRILLRFDRREGARYEVTYKLVLARGKHGHRKKITRTRLLDTPRLRIRRPKRAGRLRVTYHYALPLASNQISLESDVRKRRFSAR